MAVGSPGVVNTETSGVTGRQSTISKPIEVVNLINNYVVPNAGNKKKQASKGKAN